MFMSRVLYAKKKTIATNVKSTGTSNLSWHKKQLQISTTLTMIKRMMNQNLTLLNSRF